VRNYLLRIEKINNRHKKNSGLCDLGLFMGDPGLTHAPVEIFHKS